MSKTEFWLECNAAMPYAAGQADLSDRSSSSSSFQHDIVTTPVHNCLSSPHHRGKPALYTSDFEPVFMARGSRNHTPVPLASKQEAQLSQRDCSMLRGIEYFAKTLRVIQCHWKWRHSIDHIRLTSIVCQCSYIIFRDRDIGWKSRACIRRRR